MMSSLAGSYVVWREDILVLLLGHRILSISTHPHLHISLKIYYSVCNCKWLMKNTRKDSTFVLKYSDFVMRLFSSPNRLLMIDELHVNDCITWFHDLEPKLWRGWCLCSGMLDRVAIRRIKLHNIFVVRCMAKKHYFFKILVATRMNSKAWKIISIKVSGSVHNCVVPSLF